MNAKTKIIIIGSLAALINIGISGMFGILTLFHKGRYSVPLALIIFAINAFCLTLLTISTIKSLKSYTTFEWIIKGYCPECGYNWKTTAPKCPECGNGYT